MSGIICVINFDGTPVDAALVARMTEDLTQRGPDAQQSWVDGNAGFGFSLFRETWESASEQQPLTVAGVTIVANARLDGRPELIDRLRSAGQNVAQTDPDVNLIIAAYLAWGEKCLNYLAGDFSFIIWDAQRQRLFAARDQMGLRGLYYAREGSTLIISNEVSAILLHPLVKDNFDEVTIGDFLLFGTHLRLEKTRTAYADIRRLPGAHTLVCDREQFRIERYWTLPVDPMLRYRTEADYIEEFRHIFKLAVKDRMRADHVTISLSGGMDSSTVLAVAQQLVNSGEVNTQLQAFNMYYELIHPDLEGYYAGLVAHHLHVPIYFFRCDDYPLADPMPMNLPEPIASESNMGVEDAIRVVRSFSRIVLTGDGSDEALFDSPLIETLRRMKPVEAAAFYVDLWRHLGKRPDLGGLIPYLRAQRYRKTSKQKATESYPLWLNPDFERRLDLRNRKSQIWEWQPELTHPRNPIGYRSLLSAEWQSDVEPLPRRDITPPQYLSPFFDLRVLRFLLALPPLPWTTRKYLLRQAMKNILPGEVLRRPKAPLGLLLMSLLRQPSSEWVNHWQAEPELAQYVIREKIPPLGVDAFADINQNYYNMRPLFLNTWFRLRRSVPVMKR